MLNFIPAKGLLEKKDRIPIQIPGTTEKEQDPTWKEWFKQGLKFIFQ